jgi:hypothetical protein
MAKPNYSLQRKQREEAQRKKKEEKAQRKAERANAPPVSTEPDREPSAE